MKYLKLFETAEQHEEFQHNVSPMICYIEGDDTVFWHPEEPVNVAKLIELGYGTQSGNFVTLSPLTPYAIKDITDFDDHINNVTPRFKWNNYNLPEKITSNELIQRYNGKTLSIVPTAGLFWGIDFSDCSDFSTTFTIGTDWVSVGDGIFNSRAHDGVQYHPGPTNLTLTLTGSNPQGALQTIFSHTKRTKKIKFAASGCWCYVHAVNGMFEGCTDLETIEFSNIVMGYSGSGGWNNVQYLCHWCDKLKVFPLGFPGNDRDNTFNTIKPRNRQGESGSNAYAESMFDGCTSLTKIEPALDFSLLTAQPKNVFNGCNSLEDMHVKNLSCSWDFTECPVLSVQSIEYILNNVVDKSDSPQTVTFPVLHKSEISTSAISAAEAKGWTVVFA